MSVCRSFQTWTDARPTCSTNGDGSDALGAASSTGRGTVQVQEIPNRFRKIADLDVTARLRLMAAKLQQQGDSSPIAIGDSRRIDDEVSFPLLFEREHDLSPERPGGG